MKSVASGRMDHIRYEKNKDGARTWYIGIKVGKGEFIRRLDSDKEWLRGCGKLWWGYRWPCLTSMMSKEVDLVCRARAIEL